MTMANHQLFAQLVERETSLHRLSLRKNRDALEKILHPRFKEFGRSGRFYMRADMSAPFAKAVCPAALNADPLRRATWIVEAMGKPLSV